MDKRLFNIIGIFFLIAATLFGVNAFVSGKEQKPSVADAASLEPKVSDYLPKASPSPKPTVPIVKKVTSPDGKLEANLSELKGEQKTKWELSVADKKLFEADLIPAVMFRLPPNAFSPDNKYLFLTKETDGNVNYLVYRTNGESVTSTMDSLEITPLFNQKFSDFEITDATGWAAPNLIIVNTDKAGGGIGPSFWFEVATQKFTRLSTRFN